MTNARELAGLVGGTLLNVTTGADNLAVGKDALTANTAGGSNVAVGKDALTANTTAGTNTAVGSGAADANTTGDQLVAVGANALGGNTTGNHNVAVGEAALTANTTGADNTAVGKSALQSNTTASFNTAVGTNALDNVTTGVQNTGIGYKAGDAVTTGEENVFVGVEAGLSVTTGVRNTFVGDQAGYLVTGGSNVIIGRYSGNNDGFDMRTLSNQIVLSDGAGVPRGGYNGVVNSSYPHWNFNSPTNSYFATSVRHTGSSPYGLAVNFTGASPNNTSREFIFCNDPTASRFTVFADGSAFNATGTYSQYSDIKLKENIADASSQWDDIKAVRVRNFSMKSDNKDKANMIGVIAQELEASGMSGLVSDTFDKDANNLPTEEITKGVKQSILYMKAVKALQEAMARIETLETKVAALEAG